MSGSVTIAAPVLALAAAALYALSAPASKILMGDVDPSAMASLLYLGAGIGLVAVLSVRRLIGIRGDGGSLGRGDAPYILAMVVLDVAAPVLLMMGLSSTTAAEASLLNNFEIVATGTIAMVVFGEVVSPTLWFAIALITVSCIMLSMGDPSELTLSPGSLLILAACACWGLENNFTRRLSERDPLQVTMVKGVFSGLGAAIVAWIMGAGVPDPVPMAYALLLGFLSYGISIALYIRAQRDLGAARVSAYYAVSPFIGAGLSALLFGIPLSTLFLPALAVMVLGTALVVRDTLSREGP